MAEQDAALKAPGGAAPEKVRETARAITAMLPGEIFSDDPRDEYLTPEELEALSLFHSEHFEKEKNKPDFAKNPGTTMLRYCPAGRVVCQQGDASVASAFYILSTEDVLDLRWRQVKSAEETLAAKERGEEGPHQYFNMLSIAELQAKQQELIGEIAELERRKQEIEAAGAGTAVEQELRVAATVVLAGDFRSHEPKQGFFGRMMAALRGAPPPEIEEMPMSISIDASVDLLRSKGFQGSLRERDLFGEMSCLNRSPRSATVVASRDCYILEMLRNVLDTLHNDPAFKKRIDDNYRARVMESQIRRLSIFEEMTDDEFDDLQEWIALEDFPAGAVIIEENAPSESIYVIRSGLVTILKNAGFTLREQEFTDAHWSRLPGELAAASRDDAPLSAAVWKSLMPDAQSVATADGPPDDTAKKKLLIALNRLILKGNAVIKEIKLSGSEIRERRRLLELFDDAQIDAALVAFPDDVRTWSEYEGRVFCRYLVERVCRRGVPRRLESYGPATILAYQGAGDVIGEQGVLFNEPRNATCIAYDHPVGYHQRLPDSRTGAVPSRVEVIRIDREGFTRLMQRSDRFKRRVTRIAEQRRKQTQSVAGRPASAQSAHIASSTEFERLGLIQGQQLMLIDLNRCTRCGACVEACVDAHRDGFSRLHLDGPRIDNYLVPLTCRKCLDPVCMIGCPVGSIQRGDNGEIRIRNWCIGCGMCADQCPYGSILMNPVEVTELTEQQTQAIPAGVQLKQISERAVVCDLCQSTPSRDPSCVYACPHDAAIRINGRDQFAELAEGLLRRGPGPT
jgi:Fe-S-cluster-containing hydrogenase component 2/CRP-like cAMP-binding protein